MSGPCYPTPSDHSLLESRVIRLGDFLLIRRLLKLIAIFRKKWSSPNFFHIFTWVRSFKTWFVVKYLRVLSGLMLILWLLIEKLGEFYPIIWSPCLKGSANLRYSHIIIFSLWLQLIIDKHSTSHSRMKMKIYFLSYQYLK